MQLHPLGSLSVKCENVLPLEREISFDCIVEGKKLTANITHQEDNGYQFIYHISFSDGHKGYFAAPLQAGTWHDEQLASPYANAIAADLNSFYGFLPKKPPFCIRLKSEKEAFNVWIVPHVIKDGLYAVFYKGRYRFDVRKNKTWEAKTVREGWLIDQEIAVLVCKNIEQRSKQLLLL